MSSITSESIKNLIAFQFGKISKLSFRALNGELHKANIPLQAEQIPPLMAVYFNPLKTQREISDLLERDKAGIQRSIQTLIKDGFLKIEIDTQDKRKNRISLTPSGRFVCDKIVELMLDFDKRIRAELSEEETNFLMKVFDKLSGILECQGK